MPSPTTSVWHLGPIPLRAYALCIVAGILVAIWLTNKRLTARGGGTDDVWDVAKWAVPFGILGGRLYHVITDPELYFTKGADPFNALRIWDGGLGIPGAIALGTLGAWIGCRRRDIRLDSFGDAAVPGIALAQAMGRWGNYFNNELFGRSTTLPWRLQIHCWDITGGHAVGCHGSGTSTVMGYYQPTFLYESLWDLALAGALIYVGRRWMLGNGRVFALYVAGYGLCRLWVEALRSDHANHILGLRLNDWTAIVVFLVGLALFLRNGGFTAAREDTPYYGGMTASGPAPDSASGPEPRSASEPEPASGPQPPRPRRPPRGPARRLSALARPDRTLALRRRRSRPAAPAGPGLSVRRRPGVLSDCLKRFIPCFYECSTSSG